MATKKKPSTLSKLMTKMDKLHKMEKAEAKGEKSEVKGKKKAMSDTKKLKQDKYTKPAQNSLKGKMSKKDCKY